MTCTRLGNVSTGKLPPRTERGGGSKVDDVRSEKLPGRGAEEKGGKMLLGEPLETPLTDLVGERKFVYEQSLRRAGRGKKRGGTSGRKGGGVAERAIATF